MSLQSAGVTNLITLLPTFRAMAEADLLLLVHGESTVQGIDPFEREATFLPSLGLLLDAVPSLRGRGAHPGLGDGRRR